MPATIEATKQHDVELVLKLYELRRDPEMRKAREWYFTEFNPANATDIGRVFASGYQASGYYRMLTSYWDMAASLVLNGGIDEQIFLAANTEHIGVFAKIEPFIAEMRAASGEADYLSNLEQLVMKTPDVQIVLERRRKVFATWTKAAQREKNTGGR